jgi:hypothetical protein
MPTSRLNLPQQFGRFLLAGAFLFAAAFWGTSLILVPPMDGHRNLALLRLILKAAPHQPFQTWLQNLETIYISLPALTPWFRLSKLDTVTFSLPTSRPWESFIPIPLATFS